MKGASPTRGASPKRMSACLGEPKAPNFPFSATPHCGLLHLGVGTRLSKGPLCLSEHEVLFLFMSSVNSRNHQLD